MTSGGPVKGAGDPSKPYPKAEPLPNVPVGAGPMPGGSRAEGVQQARELTPAEEKQLKEAAKSIRKPKKAATMSGAFPSLRKGAPKGRKAHHGVQVGEQERPRVLAAVTPRAERQAMPQDVATTASAATIGGVTAPQTPAVIEARKVKYLVTLLKNVTVKEQDDGSYVLEPKPGCKLSPQELQEAAQALFGPDCSVDPATGAILLAKDSVPAEAFVGLTKTRHKIADDGTIVFPSEVSAEQAKLLIERLFPDGRVSVDTKGRLHFNGRGLSPEELFAVSGDVKAALGNAVAAELSINQDSELQIQAAWQTVLGDLCIVQGKLCVTSKEKIEEVEAQLKLIFGPDFSLNGQVQIDLANKKITSAVALALVTAKVRLEGEVALVGDLSGSERQELQALLKIAFGRDFEITIDGKIQLPGGAPLESDPEKGALLKVWLKCGKAVEGGVTLDFDTAKNLKGVTIEAIARLEKVLSGLDLKVTVQINGQTGKLDKLRGQIETKLKGIQLGVFGEIGPDGKGRVGIIIGKAFAYVPAGDGSNRMLPALSAEVSRDRAQRADVERGLSDLAGGRRVIIQPDGVPVFADRAHDNEELYALLRQHFAAAR